MARENGRRLPKGTKERELFMSLHAARKKGDHSALARMRTSITKAYEPLVLKVATYYARNARETEKFYRHGLKGLAQAIERYDPKKKYSFVTYATWWIRRTIPRQ